MRNPTHELDVRALLYAGEAVNERNEHGRDVFIYAALARHETVVGPLLEAGADVHSRDKDGMTAFCAACKGGNERIVKHRLRMGRIFRVRIRLDERRFLSQLEMGIRHFDEYYATMGPMIARKLK